LPYYLNRPLEEFVTKVGVLFAFRSQTLAIHSNGADGFDRTCAETPTIRRYQPRPSQDLTRLHRFYGEERTLGRKNFQRNLAFADQIKLVGFASLPKEMVTLVEQDTGGATGQQVNVVGFEALAERMCGDDLSQVLHGGLSLIEIQSR
jgi:hypothetical protein